MMLRKTFVSTTAILCAICLASGLVLVMMPLSDPTTFEPPDNIRDMLIFGGSLALIGLGGIFWLRSTHEKLPSSCKLIMGLTYFINILTGVLSIGIGLESNAGFASKPNVPFLIASVTFGVVTIVLGIILLIRIGSLYLGLVVTPKELALYLISKLKKSEIIIAIIAISIGVVAGIGLFNIIEHDYLSNTKILSQGLHTNAVIIEKKRWQESDAPDTYTIKYNFSSPSGEIFTDFENMEKQVWDKLQVGSQIEIAFNPVDPSENLPIEGLEKHSPWLLIFFVAISSIVVSFIVLLLLFKWIKKQT